MNLRPDLHSSVNVTDQCSCGNVKSIYKQWCDSCWDKVPIKVARNFQQRCQALARQIITCNRFIKEFDNANTQPQPNVPPGQLSK